MGLLLRAYRQVEHKNDTAQSAEHLEGLGNGDEKLKRRILHGPQFDYNKTRQSIVRAVTGCNCNPGRRRATHIAGNLNVNAVL